MSTPRPTREATRNAWLREFRPADPDAPVLICLPHAGGTAAAFFALAGALQPDVAVRAVQYPGRQDRRLEPAFVVLDDLVARLVEAVRPLTGRPYALFGHSMGAVLAYETTLRLEEEGAPPPRWLFVSGRRAPSRHRPDDVHRGSDDELLAHVGRLGGISPELLDDPDVRAMALPALRADYTLIENYRAEPGRTTSCPVTALVGDRDALVSPDEAAAWKEHTRSGFELEYFAGDHFYLTAHVPALARAITERITPVP